VEFALVLPVLLLIIFGIIDFGRMLYTKITLTQAAQNAARAGAIDGKSVGEAEGKQAAGDLDKDSLSVVVVPCPDPAPPGSDATATVTFHFTFVTPLAAIIDLGGGSVTLTSTSSSPCVG
jgi:Flp pilus assembly protein TadG